MCIVPLRCAIVPALYAILGCCLLTACAAQPSSAMSSSAASPSPPSPASATAVATVRPEQGLAIFQGQVPIEGFVACRTCHFTDPAAPVGVGPNLAGIATRGAERIPGLTAPEYIRRSIQVHDEYTVPGYAPGIARAVVGRDFAEVLSERQVEQLVAYLMTLDEPPHAADAAGGAAPGGQPSPTPPGSRPSSGVTATLALSPTLGVATLFSPSPGPSATVTAVASPSPAPSATVTAAASATPTASASATVAASATPTASASVVTASDTPGPTSTNPPLPSETPAPAPAPTPSPAPPPPAAATPTTAPTETLPSAPDDPELARYAPCVTCHDIHPLQVKMPHPLNPTCNECHRGAPSRIGCPTCHSMHSVEYHEPDPALPCTTCHASDMSTPKP
ncbi:MAG: c-type cytochrome [Chloroflexales bacterium]|nr:c-type cytochrome [Chloroflexales bacterium]